MIDLPLNCLPSLVIPLEITTSPRQPLPVLAYTDPYEIANSETDIPSSNSLGYQSASRLRNHSIQLTQLTCNHRTA